MNRLQGLTQILKDISNSYQGSGSKFEKVVEKKLTELGLNFTSQPFGSQNFPDFLIHEENEEDIFLECKSTKGHSPMWNGGYPKQDGVYLLTSQKNDSTTFFLGQDVLSKEKAEEFYVLTKAIEKVVTDHSKSWGDCDRGFNYYCRHMYIQSGGSQKTNYFSHASREKCETNVYDFLSNPKASKPYTFDQVEERATPDTFVGMD